MKSWTSPHDKIAAVIERESIQGDDVNTLYELHHTITASPSHASYRKVICNIADVVDVELPPLLSMSEVEAQFGSNLTVVIYDIHGYNFSLEYTHVYHAQEINYSDVAAITLRALRAIDTSLPLATCEMYRDYILKILIRETFFAENICQATFKDAFPNCDAAVKRNSDKIFQVYIGRNEEMSDLHFVVRAILDLKSNGNRDDVAYEKYVHMWYLHRYDLAESSIEESDLQTFHDTDAPSKHSTSSSKKDVSVGVLATKDAAEEVELDGDIEVKPIALPASDDAAVTPSNTFQCASLPLSEIWGWGNPGCAIYAQQTKTYEFMGDPQAVLIPPVVNLEGVAMIACSQRHVLLLTRSGVIYATGDNTEGALGLGDVTSRNRFEPVVFTSAKEVVITKIAAASGAIGSSSFAIDDAGGLYSWGAGYASGTGTAKPLLMPNMVALPTVNEKVATVVDVACGSGFAVAVLSTGQVASWGMWAHGRLGQGQPPLRQTPAGLFSRGRTKVPRYQLLPKLIPHLKNVAKVACGEAHAVVLTKSGFLIAWGQNSLGQVGIGCSPSGFLRDIFSPRQLDIPAKFIDICCGGFHSLAVDENRGVWSWGARGMSCLGRLSTQITGYWASKVASLFSVTTTNTKVMVPYELILWCNRFSTPHRIEGLSENIIQISAGDMHSAFLCSNGQIFLCGEGSVIPPVITPDSQPAAGIIEGTDEPTDRTPKVTFVTIPRCPSPMWMNQVSTRRIKYIASGGLHMLVLADDDFISPSMTDSLRRQALPKSDISVFDDVSQTSDTRPGDLTDCRIIVAGRVLRAHRAVVASRSSVLRDMLLEEDPLNDEIASGPTVILLPDVLYTTARVLLNYIYTGTLSYQTVRDVTLLHGLSRAAKAFKIPRLQVACDRLLQIHESASVLPLKEVIGDMEQEVKALRQSLLEMHLDVPPSTLSRDMGNLVGDPQYSDVRFVAEGRVICAHRFVLQSRCDYFRAMFETGMAESVAADASKQVFAGSVDIVVPDTFVGFLRFLIFLYTDVLPDGSDEALLEDLSSADRYQMRNMKTLVENMILVTEINWHEVLRAALMFNSIRLKVEVYQFLKDHASALTGQAWEEVKADFPDSVDELLTLQMQAFPSPPSQLLIERSNESIEQKKGKEETFQMPWWTLLAALLGALAYTYAIRVISLGPLVPVLNLVAFAGIVVYFVRYVLGA